MSILFVPIFDEDDVTVDKKNNETTRRRRKLVGAIAAVFEWRVYFEDLLPSNFPGLVVVLSNGCDESFSYEIIGRRAVSLGPGDRHDARYDGYLEQQAALGAIVNDRESVFGMKLNQDICPYKIQVYLTACLEAQYITILPMCVTIAVLLVFAFTAVVFVLFDYIVERRQAVVLWQATRSSALVTSLFPAGVRDRLMDENKNTTPQLSQ
jgi:hypothetical protein